MAEGKKLWGGRFSTPIDPLLEKLNRSIDLDKRLYKEDIQGSKMYAESLKVIGMLTDYECKQIIKGLDKVKEEWDSDKFDIKSSDEDIHTANERRLKELIGEPATKLHVGRSRNDQVITDMKLWMRSSITELSSNLRSLVKTLVTRADREIDVKMPGYTHLQRAQPVRWSHYLLSYAWTLKNDHDSITNLLDKLGASPLGSGALAGNPFPIDREALAHKLGFNSVTKNSMQAVGDRDFCAEFLFYSSMIGIHLSRLAEDLILYSTKEFGFVTISESHSTGSSLMPQKRNPDSLELIRGIGGSLTGQCCGFLTVLKGTPSTYNKDLQCDKEAVFSSYDKLMSIVQLSEGTVRTLHLNSEKCEAALSTDMLATDLAYYLVRKGVAFRDAHGLAGTNRVCNISLFFICLSGRFVGPLSVSHCRNILKVRYRSFSVNHVSHFRLSISLTANAALL
ncbi:unnamed protein product [Acanthoscelides obtectus]|uniref:Argininosuccinate lyase n=1 Tax=Acanthoscelides obtectus TaxID=200917 RepID=A0A9P0P402_ACAOB|nr:unnamed protein product [Acanthoscelides obtectus]CAK1643030.1 Argininosuccinate lyase [Acanthoscelides obtectus]